MAMSVRVEPADDILRAHANKLGALGAEKGHAALARAVNRTAQMARTRVVRAIAKQSSIPQKVVRKQIRLIQVKPGMIDRDIEAQLVASGNDMSLRDFKPKQMKYGVRARVWGKLQRFPGAFIYAGTYNSGQTVAGGHVFHRVTAKSTPLEMMFGPAVPREMVRGESAKAFDEVIRSHLPGRIRHEIDRLLT